MASKVAELLLRIKSAGEEKIEALEEGFEKIGKTASIAFALISAAITKSLMDYREQEKATEALTQAMINSGIYSQELKNEYLEQASALQKLSLFGDEQIIAAQAVIQSQVGLLKVTPELTQATLDLAQAQGMDLQSAAEMVGKTIGTNTNALARQGLELADNMTTSQKLAATVEFLNGKWEGQALAATKGLGGVTQLKNAFSDLLENIGEKLAPAIVFLTSKIKSVIDTANEHQGIIKFIAAIAAGSAVITGLVAALAGAGIALTSIMTLATGLGLTLGALLGPIALVGAGVAALAIGIGTYMTKGTQTATGAITDLETKIKETRTELEKWQAFVDTNSKKSVFGATEEDVKRLDTLKDRLNGYEESLRRLNSQQQIVTQNSAEAIASEINKQEQLKKINDDAAIKKLEQKTLDNAMEKELDSVNHQENMAQLITNESDKSIALLTAQQARLQSDINHQNQLITNAKTNADKLKAMTKKDELEEKLRKTTAAKNELEFEAEKNKKFLKDRADTLSTISSLQSSSNSTLAMIGKAAALTQIAIATPEAVAKAYTLGPIAGPPAAALVYAAMAAQAARVAGIPLADGGIVMPRPGGTQATIGEAGSAEAVIPLDKFPNLLGGGGGGGITLNVYGGLLGDQSSAYEFAKAIDRELLKLRQNNESSAFDTGVV